MILKNRPLAVNVAPSVRPANVPLIPPVALDTMVNTSPGAAFRTVALRVALARLSVAPLPMAIWPDGSRSLRSSWYVSPASVDARPLPPLVESTPPAPLPPGLIVPAPLSVFTTPVPASVPPASVVSVAPEKSASTTNVPCAAVSFPVYDGLFSASVSDPVPLYVSSPEPVTAPPFSTLVPGPVTVSPAAAVVPVSSDPVPFKFATLSEKPFVSSVPPWRDTDVPPINWLLAPQSRTGFPPPPIEIPDTSALTPAVLSSSRVPSMMSVAPVKLFAVVPARTEVLVPTWVRPPTPDSAPLSVRGASFTRVRLAFRRPFPVRVRGDSAPMSLGAVTTNGLARETDPPTLSRVPPLRVMVPDPRDVLGVTATMPDASTVPPV